MDYLDPRKQRTHTIRLMVIYVVTAIVILLATAALLRIAHGASLGKDGQVVQNGFVFVSSQPGNGTVYVNGKEKGATSVRLQLPEGPYSLDVKRTGYHTWHRDVKVIGDSVVRYDYPLLVPTDLIASPVKTYSTVPVLTLQSPDRRWMLIQQPGSLLGFDMFDMNDPKAVVSNAKSISFPESVLTSASGEQSWTLTEWSNDNRHVVLQHNFTGGSEYVLLDRDDPSKSVNLTKTLHLNPGQVVSLRDKKFDQYYIFDGPAKTVSAVTLSNPDTETPVLTGALAFKSYAADMLLYVTETNAQPGHVESMLRDGDSTYRIADHLAGAPYLLNLAQYSGDWFVAVGSSAAKLTTLKPVRLLKMPAPNYIDFSANTRFIMVENGQQFAMYDAEYDKSYNYIVSQPLDAPQPHAIWMDGDRVTYVSGGKQVIFDYDNLNTQTLSATTPGLLPFFDRNYHFIYNLTPASAATGQSILTQTGLLIPKDQ
jgi:hypothetical protein